MAEELDEKSQASLDKDTKEPRKRKRTEKGRSWDETVEHETVIAKKLIVDQPSERGHSSTQAIVQEETSLPKETVSADKPGGKSKKKPVRQPPPKQKAAAAERKEKEKSNETRSQKTNEKKEQKSAEIQARKSLADQFFEAAHPKKPAFTTNSMTVGQENREMIAEHCITDMGTKQTPISIDEGPMTPLQTQLNKTSYVTPVLENRNPNKRAFNGRTAEMLTPNQPRSNAFTKTPTFHYDNIRPTTFPAQGEREDFEELSCAPSTNIKTSYFSPVLNNSNRHASDRQSETNTPLPRVDALRKTLPIHVESIRPTTDTLHSQTESGDLGGLFRASMSLANGDIDEDDSFFYDPDQPPPLATNTLSECPNCEKMKKEIESLKRNQMPGNCCILYPQL